jgi:hypothetical protein
MLPHDSPTHLDRTTPDGATIVKYQDDVAIGASTITDEPVILIEDDDDDEEKRRYKPKRPRNCFTDNFLTEKLGSHPPIGLYMLYYFCKVENFCHNLFISQKEILARIFSSDDEKYQSAEFYKLVPSSLSDQLRVKLKAARLLDNSNPWTDMYKDEHIANLDYIQKLDGMLPSKGFKTDAAMHWYFRGILAVLEFFCPMPISKKCLTNDTDEIKFFTDILIQTNDDERRAFHECPGPHRQKAFNYLFHLLMTFEYDRYVYLKSREYMKNQLEDNPIPTFYEDPSSPKSNRFYFHNFIPSGAKAVTSKMLGSAVNTLIPDEWCNHQQLGIFMQWLQDKSVALGRKCHFHLPCGYMEDDLYHGNCFKDARLLFYPIHFKENHWISVFAYRKTINEEDTWNFYYYDSLYQHLQEKEYVKAFEEYIAKKGSSMFFPKGHKRMIRIVPNSKSFIQRDSVNCGYFTMLCAFNLLKHIDDDNVLIKWSQTEIDIDNFKLSIYIRMCTKELMDKSITHYMPYYDDGTKWRKRLDRGAVKI